MTQLAVERIKLFSTRSPYWCMGAIIGVALLFTLPFSLIDRGRDATIELSQAGLQLGMMIIMILAALAMTTEYRFGTIRVTFLAEPRRHRVLAAKTGLLVIIAAVTAAVLGPAALWFTALLAKEPQNPLSPQSATDWRLLFGNVALFAIAAVIAVSVGAMVRHSAGAISILLLWPTLIESLVALIPKVGQDIQLWLPFSAGGRLVMDLDAQVPTFGSADLPPEAQEQINRIMTSGPTPLQGVLIFAATAVVLWIAALIIVRKRDA